MIKFYDQEGKIIFGKFYIIWQYVNHADNLNDFKEIYIPIHLKSHNVKVKHRFKLCGK